MSRENYTDSWVIEYYMKGEKEPKYQIFSQLNECKLEEVIDNYLNNEFETLAGSYFFFDAVPVEVETLRLIDNTIYHVLRAQDQNDPEIDIRIDNRGVIKNIHQHISTGAWFPYYHVISGLDLSNY
jgi:hypothetical protein